VLIAAGGSAGVFFMCAAAFSLFRINGNTVSESVSYAVICVFMVISFVRQLSFITGISVISTGGEMVLLVASLILIFKQRSHIFSIFNIVKNFISANPMISVFLGVCVMIMAIHAVLPLSKECRFEFSNILIDAGNGVFSPKTASDGSAIVPMNHLVLFQPFLGFGTGSSTGVFCFLAYLSIGFSTYALSRRYSWPPTAFTTTLLIMSMPRLVVQSICPGTEIISVAVALFCILVIYRSVEQPNLTDLIFLILGIFFCISENISGMIFAPILFVLSCVVFFRRHGLVAWKSILGENRYAFFAALPGVIFSQCWLFWYNPSFKVLWSGSASAISFNRDGIQGTLANAIRYLFESVYFTALADVFFQWRFKWDMAQALQSLYDCFVRPVLGESGAVQAFYLTWMQNEAYSFGPVGFFLVLPALFYAMVKGPRRLKAVALSFFVYFYLVCLIIAWAPGNVKFLGNFFIGSGFTIAFFLPPWRFTKRIKRIFQAGSCFLLFLTLFSAL